MKQTNQSNYDANIPYIDPSAQYIDTVLRSLFPQLYNDTKIKQNKPLTKIKY